MEQNSQHRVKIELIPSMLLLWFLFIALVLTYANQSSWQMIDKVASTLFNAQAPYIEILIVLFSCISLYSVIIVVVGLKRPSICQNKINVVLPILFIVVLELILHLYTIVNFRIRLDFIWFALGTWTVPVYLSSVCFIIVLIFLLITNIKALWSSDRSNPRTMKQMLPRTTAIFLIIAVAIAIPVYFEILSYFPWTFVFWTNLASLYLRYASDATPYWVILLACPCICIFFVGYARKFSAPGGRIGKQIRLAGFGFACVILGVILGVTVQEIDISLQNMQGKVLEGYATYPFIVIATILAVFGLKYVFFKEKQQEVLNHNSQRKLSVIFLRISRKKGFGISLVAIVLASAFFLTPLVISPPDVDVQPTFEIRTINGIPVPFENDIIYPNFERQPEVGNGGGRTYLNLTGTWRFLFTPGASDLSFYIRTPAIIARLGSGFESVTFDDSNWAEMAVPSSFNRFDNPIEAYRGVQGVCWYRTWVSSSSLHPDFGNQSILLKCLGANYFTDIWVDGKYAGFHEGGFTSFALDITNRLDTKVTTHLLAIRVDSIGFKTAYYDKVVPGFADWFNYAGIVRDIYIEIAPKVHVARADIRAVSIQPYPSTAHIGNASIAVNVSMEISEQVPSINLTLALHSLSFPDKTAMMDEHPWRYLNESLDPSFRVSGSTSVILSPTDIQAGQFTACSLTFSVENLSLWTNKQPNLYALEINLSRPEDQGLIDRFVSQVGFRNFTIDNSKFLLNSAPIYLAGASIHEEWANSGRTLTSEQIFTDLSNMQNLSCNTFRSHYPLHPIYYLYADRLGLTAWQECPDYWFNEVNFIEANLRGSTVAMFLAMLYRDFNRPSIFFQGVTNEPISEKLLASYLQERKILLASTNPSRILGYAEASQIITAAVVSDFVGFNCYWGLEGGILGEHYEQATYAISVVAANNPGKPILITEFGTGHTLSDSNNITFQEYCRAFEDNPAIAGMLYWVFADYVGYADTVDPMGIFNWDRSNQRPTAHVMGDIYSNLTSTNP